MMPKKLACGAEFETPPTPENTLLGGGGIKGGGGRIKFLLRGASKYTPHTPHP